MTLNITISTPNSSSAVIDPISDRVRDIFQYVNCVFLSSIISVFGIITNIVNIVVYKRLGFKESMHVSLFAIAISDIASLLTLLWTCMLSNPDIIAAPLDIIPLEFAYLTGAIPHTRFMRITCWLTALVTIERCMCLVTPLKVKSIFTPRSSTISAVAIFVFFLLTQTLNFVGTKLDWKFDKAENRSRIGIVPTSLFEHTRVVVNRINITSQFLSLFVIAVSNLSLLYFLKKRATWRNRMSGPTATWNDAFSGNRTGRQIEFCCLTKTTLRLDEPRTEVPRSHMDIMPDGKEAVSKRYLTPPTPGLGAASMATIHSMQASRLTNASSDCSPTTRGSVHASRPTACTSFDTNTTSATMRGLASSVVPAAETSAAVAERRNQRRCRMIILLSAIMIFSFLPNTICLVLSTSYNTGFGLGKRLHNSFVAAYSVTFVFEAINASVNIFLYYMMSTNYRRTLDKMMLLCSKKSRRVGDTVAHQ